MRRRIAVSAVVVLLGLAGCTSTKDPVASPSATAPSVSVAPSPSDSASPSPTPTPSASPSPSPSPTRGPSPKPTQSTTPAGGPISCTGKATLNRPQATGTGPAGSILRTGTDAVALTFDDGPDPINTPKILDMLKQCGVKATFCLVGFRARDRPDLVRRIYAEGHTLCNHSWQHLTDLGKRTHKAIVDDLTGTNKAIHAIVPDAKIAYFRAPGGNFTAEMVQIAKDLGMASIYWHVDPRDWDSSAFGKGSKMVNHVISAVEGNVRPGSIILSHDNGKPDTITAYRTLLPWLAARFDLIALPVDAPLP
ncbi:hypothetical protein Cs7R123_68710 [Catellatospora sp. TT07R-123]|uniref:polysaccharide deacetylase family protein n=1 Tax=Catellatospora sp. TT07R-123 TaxID=2733863 RepID=UPI001B23DC74|nr:polysaccharide deacetylase family protein [Catellatospora sp. TT07R-123]GHJ49529.1 hypothetical protein Cs7R123_68710 [Catellatospora sp. TT07R-123]